MKKCTKCRIEKNESEFCKDKYTKDGLCGCCKQCRKKDNDLPKNVERRKKYHNSPEQIAYRASPEHKEYMRQQEKLPQRIAYLNSPARKIRQKETKRQYRIDHKDEISAKWIIYRDKPEGRLVRREYFRNRKKNNPAYKLICNLRSRTWRVLKGQQKTISTKDGIGCSPEELVRHIESQWTEGMNWQNYGEGDNKWNIDHIFPFHLCDQNDPDAIVRNNHYTNLRPMWHKDNVGRKYEEYK